MPATSPSSPTPAVLKPFDRFLLFVVRYGLFFVFCIPFIVVLSYLYPWVSGKIWGFELMVEILLPFWIILAFRRKEYRPAANAFLWALLAYFAVTTVAMLVGDMPHRSMWSKPDRLTGMFFQYHLLAFFLMASTAWRRMISWAAAVSVAAATVAATWGFVEVYVNGGAGGRGQATLGNADYLGQYLVPHLFLAAWLFWQNRRQRWWTLWYGLCGVLLMLGIFSTKSRGALLGVLLASVAGLLIAALKGKGKLKILGWVGLAGVVALVGLYFLANRYKPAAAWLYSNRMSLQYIQETSGSRALLLTNAVKAFEARPVLGWGPENFESAYYYYYDPVTLRYSDYETRQDRPHNLILELLVDFGIIGLLAYAMIFVFGWKLVLRSTVGAGEASLLVMASVAHLATNLFIFETPISSLTLFFILAVLAASITPNPEAGEDDLTPVGVPVGIVAALGIIWLMSYAVFASMRGAKLTATIVSALSAPPGTVTVDQITSLTDELKTIKTPEEERYIRTVVSNLSANYGEYATGPLKPVLADLVGIEAAQASSQQHDFVNGLVVATGEESQWPRTAEQQAALEEAAARIQRLSPNRQEVFWVLGQIAKEKGDLKGAEADFQHAIDLDPAARVPKARFAAFLLGSAQVDRAVAYLKANWPTLKVNDESSAVVSRAVLHLLDLKQDDALLELYDQAKQQNMLTFEWSVAGALGAMDKGAWARAQAIIADTEARFPDKAALVEKYLVPQLQASQASAAAAKPNASGPTR